MLAHEEAAKVNNHSIKCLSKIIKKKWECHICQVPRRRYLEVYCDARERWLLHGIKTNILYITHFLHYFRNQFWTFIHSLLLHLIIPTSSLANLVRDLPTSDSTSQSFWRHYGFKHLEQNRFTSTLSCWLDLHGRSCLTT